MSVSRVPATGGSMNRDLTLTQVGTTYGIISFAVKLDDIVVTHGIAGLSVSN